VDPICDTTQPAHLRTRARTLRALATQLECTPAVALAEVAGPDTWQSPRVEVCRWILGANLAQLTRAVDQLRWTAHRLETRATDLELSRARSWGAS
jgi:hypothetical protein